MKKLLMAAAGAAFIALGTFGAAPATAALLEFSFTTSNGGTGSFTLDTDTAPDGTPGQNWSAVYGRSQGYPLISFDYAATVLTRNFVTPQMNQPYLDLS